MNLNKFISKFSTKGGGAKSIIIWAPTKGGVVGEGGGGTNK